MKILFLTLYDRLHPSTRFRVFQFLPYLPKDVSYTVRPVIPEGIFRRLYGSKGRLRKVLFILFEYVNRMADICRSWRYDAVYVQKGLTHIRYRGILPLLRLLNRNVIFDFDDAVVFGEVSSFTRFPWKLLEDERRALKLVRTAQLVIAGNKTLMKDVLEYNDRTVVIPTPVDTDYYAPGSDQWRKGTPVKIIWSGKRDGYKDLSLAAEALRRLAAVRPIQVTVLADVYDPVLEPMFAGVPFHFERWSVESEKRVLLEGDIGIMPLHDTLWHRRKCAYKALLYMACGVPVVSSPVGLIVDIVDDGRNGLLARDSDEWHERLCRLADNATLREEMGRAGRVTVEERYSLAVWGHRWAEAVVSVAAKR